jgi:hypothetical protein
VKVDGRTSRGVIRERGAARAGSSLKPGSSAARFPSASSKLTSASSRPLAAAVKRWPVLFGARRRTAAQTRGWREGRERLAPVKRLMAILPR